MKAVGATHNQVMFVFVIQSIIVSVFGVAIGLGLGLFALYVRNDFLHLMDRLTGFELFPASIYGFTRIAGADYSAGHRHYLRRVARHLPPGGDPARLARQQNEHRGGAAL